ncbi:MAG: hypothetical protein QG608_2481, partial [Actinomycetota bacterium]|nr:hypothetical protein [Actinomycetota bacterium]
MGTELRLGFSFPVFVVLAVLTVRVETFPVRAVEPGPVRGARAVPEPLSSGGGALTEAEVRPVRDPEDFRGRVLAVGRVVPEPFATRVAREGEGASSSGTSRSAGAAGAASAAFALCAARR